MKAAQVAAVRKKLEAHVAETVPESQKHMAPIHQAAGGPGWAPVVAVTGYEIKYDWL